MIYDYLRNTLSENYDGDTEDQRLLFVSVSRVLLLLLKWTKEVQIKNRLSEIKR